MKKMMSLVVLALVASGLGLSVWSAPMVESWIQPLTSRAAMRSYLVERSTQVYVDTYGDGVLSRSGDSLWLGGTNALDLCATISGQTLNFRVADGHHDQVNQTVQMYDRDNNSTFIGWKSLILIGQNDGALLVANPEIKIAMADRVSVEVPADVKWVNVRTCDENGNQVGGTFCAIFERNGRFYLDFPLDAVGDAFAPGYYGELVVQRQTEEGYETSLYTLGTGLAVTTTDVGMTVIPTLEGVTVLAPDSDITEILPSVDGVGVNTLFALTVTVKRDVTIKAKTSEGEVAVGCFIRCLEGEMVSSTAYYITLPATGFALTAGRYHVWFSWASFHEADERGSGWDDYYGDERGK